MPRAPKYCSFTGCRTLVTGRSRCHDHSGWKTSPRTASAGRTSTATWKRNRVLALQRDDYQCQIRGPKCTVDAGQVDHVVPVHRGGTDDLTNLASTCHNCHAAKTAREARAARG